MARIIAISPAYCTCRIDLNDVYFRARRAYNPRRTQGLWNPPLLSDYWQFARRNTRFLGFGLLLCLASSGGQTYFIGIFGPGIRAEFGLSHTEWGTLYLIGTLGSALVLPWSGQLLDRFDLRAFSAVAMLGLTLACLSISLVSAVWMIAVAIFLLRQFGQGLLSLTGTTSMARYYGPNRGKAIALASMGYSIGEATLPLSAVLAIAALGWRTTYQFAALAIVLLIPLALWLLRGQGERHRQHIESLTAESPNGSSAHYTRAEVLRERRFYLMLPALLAPSFIITALFFHHLTLAEYKQWSAQWVTGNYWLYALATVGTSLSSGPIIDRITAVRIMPLFLLPLAAGLLIVGPAESPLLLLPYMVLIGINTGVYFTGMTAMWAELYGARFLGAIKSLMTAMTVLASALGPVSVGLMLDAGMTMNQVCSTLAIACLAFTLPLIRALQPR